MFVDRFGRCVKPDSVFELADPSFCGKVVPVRYHPQSVYAISSGSKHAHVATYRSRILSYSLANLSLAPGMLTP